MVGVNVMVVVVVVDQDQDQPAVLSSAVCSSYLLCLMKLQILVKTLQIILQNLHVCGNFEEKRKGLATLSASVKVRKSCPGGALLDIRKC